MNDTTKFVTSDIGIAAYLQLLNKKLLLCERDPSGRFRFEFEDSDNDCESKSLEFVNSDFCKFDNHIRNLKKLLFDRR